MATVISRLSLPPRFFTCRGAGWGEDGYIRVARYGSSPQGEPCGTDPTPGDGDGCSGGPSSIEVCGLCGILSDSSYPVGAQLNE
jgi:cathepsin L